jgi:hypothetical protein
MAYERRINNMNTTQEAIGEYKKELRAYKKWTDEKKKVYGENSSPMATWDSGDYHQVMEWNSKISGMEKILGLSKKEIKKYMKEAGIVE